MIRRVAALAVLLLAAAPSGADEKIVSGLSQNRVSITADFDGSEILVFGAVKRDAPAPAGALEVIVTVEGPPTPLTIRRKDRVWGIWINDAAVEVESAPSFYAVATTGPLTHILKATENLRHAITIDREIRAIGITSEADASEAFIEAMMRVRTAEGRYRLLEGKVELTEDTLFRADITLPSNLTDGEYKVRLFLLRGGQVITAQERLIGVRKEGLERLIFNMAHQRPLAYGLLSLVLAVVAGWGASLAFRLFRV